MAGHAAAAEGGARRHGARWRCTSWPRGVWAGGLVPARPLPRMDAAARERSRGRQGGRALLESSASGAVTVLAVTGVYAAWQQVGGVPALLGTDVRTLAPAEARCCSRRSSRWRRGIFWSGVAGSRRRAPAPEAALVALRRNVVPGGGAGRRRSSASWRSSGSRLPRRHDEIAWPLSFRFDWVATKALPGVQTRVAIGSQVATLGLVALLLALVIRPRRWRVAALGGGVALALGAIARAPSARRRRESRDVRAARRTVRCRVNRPGRAALPGALPGLPRSGRLRRRAGGRGSPPPAGGPHGPARRGSHGRRPLLVGHARNSRIRDAGLREPVPPEARWDVINFVRALGAAERTRDLGPVATTRPAVVAPDFTFTTGVGEGRALRDWRGRGVVLLVFFTLPGSADRLVELNRLLVATEAARWRDPRRAALGSRAPSIARSAAAPCTSRWRSTAPRRRGQPTCCSGAT